MGEEVRGWRPVTNLFPWLAASRAVGGPARGEGEVEKISAQRGRLPASSVIAPEQSAELFSCPQHFPPPRASPPIVRGGQIEQLETAVHGGVTALGSSGFVRPDRAVDFASDVRELFDQCQ